MPEHTHDALMDALAAPFELWEHEYRKQGRGDDVMMYLTYVGIEHAIARFNRVLGSRWSWTVLDVRLAGTTEKPAVIVHGRISFTADDQTTAIHRDGLGAAQWQSQADDLDKIVKSAMAEAFKKASHQFGMAGYLWDKGLADQIALELLKEEGRPWLAKSRPKLPRKGNPAASILASVQASKAVAPRRTTSVTAPLPEAPTDTTSLSDGGPAEAGPSDPAWLQAFDELKAYVKTTVPQGSPAQWTETISNLVDGRFRTRSPRAVSAAELAQFARELQRAQGGQGTEVSPSRARSGGSRANAAPTDA